MNRYLADDQGLPYLYVRAGKRVVFKNIFCPVRHSDKTWRQVYRQKIRWLMPQRIGFPNRWAYLAIALFSYPVALSFLYWMGSGFSSIALAFLAVTSFFRIMVSTLFEFFMLGSVRMNLRYFWLIPLWDIAQLYFVPYGFLLNTVEADGKTYRVVDRAFVDMKAGPL